MRVPQVEASRKSCVASRSLSKTRTSTMWSREMHRNLASAKKLLSRLKELKNPCFTGGWKEWQVNPEMSTSKWNQHYFDARFWERSPGHTVSVIKNIIYPKVYSNRHHFISHFSPSFTTLILKRRWRFFLPWRKFCPKWKVIKERCFALEAQM